MISLGVARNAEDLGDISVVLSSHDRFKLALLAVSIPVFTIFAVVCVVGRVSQRLKPSTTVIARESDCLQAD